MISFRFINAKVNSYCKLRSAGCILARRLNTTSQSQTGGCGEEEPVFEQRVEVAIGGDSSRKAAISVVQLNDSGAKNALSKRSVYRFLDILDQLKDERLKNGQVRAMIVKSNVPGVFCAGANLKERRSMSNIQVEDWLQVQRSLMDKLSKFAYPTIAAIDGVALGGGLELALACDIRIVNEKARVGLVETRLAIIPGAGGTQRLARLIGTSRAKEHIFAAEPIEGPEAVRLGIANHLASGENGSYEKALELAKKFCLRGPKALRLAKFAIDYGSQASLETGLNMENACYSQLFDSLDRVEGLKAFAEKREPLYTDS